MEHAADLQEREAAKELPGASTAADKTFEPGEGMAEAGAAPTGDQAMTGTPRMLHLGMDRVAGLHHQLAA